MLTAIIVLLILVAILLVAIVLVQDSKGGLTAQSSASQLMGVKRTTDLLERLTWGGGIAIMVLCLLSSTVLKSEESEVQGSVNIEKAASGPAPAPAAPAQQQPAQVADSVAATTK